MTLNQEGVEKAARAIWRTEWGETVFPDETGIEYEELCAKATAALTAYFDHLREAGLMYEAQFNARYHVTSEGCFILRAEKE